MRIAMTGKNGQVAQALSQAARLSGHEILSLSRPDFDLSAIDPIKTRKLLSEFGAEVLISASAYTQVDQAESEPDLAQIINGNAPKTLSQICQDLKIPLIHLSTDYVFNGKKSDPYIETDPCDPINIYGQTKLSGELGVAEATDNYAIFRTSWVYSPFGSNFVKTIVRLANDQDHLRIVSDQLGGPTSAHDIALGLISISEQLRTNPDPRLRGIFHLSTSEHTHWAEFAETIAKALDQAGLKRPTIMPIASKDYPTPAKRPANSRLNCQKLYASYGLKLPEWRVSLQTTLNSILTEGHSL